MSVVVVVVYNDSGADDIGLMLMIIANNGINDKEGGELEENTQRSNCCIVSLLITPTCAACYITHIHTRTDAHTDTHTHAHTGKHTHNAHLRQIAVGVLLSFHTFQIFFLY